MVKVSLDCRGQNCPVPLVEVRKALKKASKGDEIEVTGSPRMQAALAVLLSLARRHRRLTLALETDSRPGMPAPSPPAPTDNH